MILAKPETIVENANGIAYKFAGGMMICVRMVTSQSAVTTVAYAEKFISNPLVYATNIYSYSDAIVWSVSTVNESTVTLYTFNPRGTTLESYDAYIVAIGRWK